jgi:hypothetical protein
MTVELIARLEKTQLKEKIVEAAMIKYRVSKAENDPARGAFLASAVKDLDEACRKLDEHDRQAARG